MITFLATSNFKAWKNLELSLGGITGLFGTNSSGKSSILQFLLMLKQTKEATDRALVLDFGDKKGYVNLGSFNDVVFRHAGSTLEWKLEWDLRKNIKVSDPSQSSKSVLFDVASLYTYAKVSKLKSGIETEELLYGYFDAETPVDYYLRRERDAYELGTTNERYRFVRNPGRAWNLPSPVKSYIFPDQVQTYFQNTAFLSHFVAEYDALMDSIYYLGPLREYPQREYTWTGTRPNDVGKRGEKVVDAILAAVAQHEERNFGKKGRRHSFDEFVAKWLQDMGLIYSFRVEEIASGSGLYRVKIKKTQESSEVYITDVGFGVSQVLPVLVLLFYVPKGSVVLLEQPEIHLHPAVQSALADVIICAVQTREVQVILESHSEHLLRRLQLRLAEEKIGRSDISLYFCETIKGQSVASELLVNEYGQISNWPKDFFGDAFGEIAKTQQARLLRMIEAEGGS